MPNISDRFNLVSRQLRQTEIEQGRQPGSVRLLAVSKYHSVSDIRHLAALGQRHFGESYLQDALTKMAECEDLNLTWHFIGRIQKNKCGALASHFHWVHGIDRLIIAQRLSRQRPANMPPLNLCIQVNISDEPAKGGIPPDPTGLLELSTAISQLPQVRLRGLMGMAAAGATAAEQTAAFGQLHTLFAGLNRAGFGLDTLSMGMSGDYPQAIAAGSTLVRIGRALFGPPAEPRPNHQSAKL
ncbi:MAG: YggS family pyridoxal phosphate-dependent enzyme [Gammaproteobacteria bacterium]|nr:YggS family pyridoxal phosphate-dependent enzyme [Gammaproteobacteria bacterium]